MDNQKLDSEAERLGIERFRAITDRARIEYDKYRAELDRYRADLERSKIDVERNKPLVEAMMRFAELTIRSLLLLNGGAALALLTFAGNTYRAGDSSRAAQLAPVVLAFGIGAASSVATSALAYVAQVYFGERDDGAIGNRWRWAAIACGVASLIAFASGIVIAWIAFR